MIKLIATDLDGTLLDPAGNLPAGTFETINKLHERGILFCVASGRQLVALQAMFRPVADKTLFIAENGAIVARGSEALHIESLPKEQVLRVLDAVLSVEGAYPLLCTPQCAYFSEYRQPFVQYVQASYISNKRRDLYETAEHEPVCKVSIYDERGPETNCLQALPARLSDLRLTLSGGNWLDVSEKTANKGNAMQFIQEKFALTSDECAAFGDHMNDCELLCACAHPYLPENAYPRLKEQFPKAVIVPPNAENGVLRALEAIACGKPVPRAR